MPCLNWHLIVSIRLRWIQINLTLAHFRLSNAEPMYDILNRVNSVSRVQCCLNMSGVSWHWPSKAMFLGCAWNAPIRIVISSKSCCMQQSPGANAFAHNLKNITNYYHLLESLNCIWRPHVDMVVNMIMQYMFQLACIY